MKLFSTITLFAGLAAAIPTLTPRDGPSGHEVEIAGFTFGGSGCPAGTVGSILSDDLTTLTLIYDQFIAQAGPGLHPKDYRENCQVNVKLHFPQGWQFSVFKADYRGHATLPKGDTGTVKANYYFSGSTQQVSFAFLPFPITEVRGYPRLIQLQLTLLVNQVARTQNFMGPVDQDYLKSDVFGVESTVWSPCGSEGMLNINSAVQISPLDSQKPALLTVRPSLVQLDSCPDG